MDTLGSNRLQTGIMHLSAICPPFVPNSPSPKEWGDLPVPRSGGIYPSHPLRWCRPCEQYILPITEPQTTTVKS